MIGFSYEPMGRWIGLVVFPIIFEKTSIDVGKTLTDLFFFDSMLLFKFLQDAWCEDDFQWDMTSTIFLGTVFSGLYILRSI